MATEKGDGKNFAHEIIELAPKYELNDGENAPETYPWESTTPLIKSNYYIGKDMSRIYMRFTGPKGETSAHRKQIKIFIISRTKDLVPERVYISTTLSPSTFAMEGSFDEYQIIHEGNEIFLSAIIKGEFNYGEKTRGVARISITRIPLNNILTPYTHDYLVDYHLIRRGFSKLGVQ